MAKVKVPEARSLTRRERRKMRELNIDPAFIKKDDERSVSELNEQIVDFMCEDVYKLGAEADELLYSELVKLADVTYRKTYALDKDIKNSSASGSGTLTDATNTVASA